MITRYKFESMLPAKKMEKHIAWVPSYLTWRLERRVADIGERVDVLFERTAWWWVYFLRSTNQRLTWWDWLRPAPSSLEIERPESVTDICEISIGALSSRMTCPSRYLLVAKFGSLLSCSRESVRIGPDKKGCSMQGMISKKDVSSLNAWRW